MSLRKYRAGVVVALGLLGATTGAVAMAEAVPTCDNTGTEQFYCDTLQQASQDGEEAVDPAIGTARDVAAIGPEAGSDAVGAAGEAIGNTTRNCQGDHCLPAEGYTFNRHWDCGRIYRDPATCWYDRYLGDPNMAHTWGFGSADYDGGEEVYVALETETGAFWHFALRLARACYHSDCNDQDGHYTDMYVYWARQGSSEHERHTIYGHGLA